MGKHSGTFNLSESDLHNMETHPSKSAMEYGKRVPFHLQYVRDQEKKQKEHGEPLK